MTYALADTSLLKLLIELLKDGKAEIIPELAPLEPIDIDVIVTALRQKTGIDHGRDFEAWYGSFLECPEVTEDERKTLKLMKRMLERERYFVERITGNRWPVS